MIGFIKKIFGGKKSVTQKAGGDAHLMKIDDAETVAKLAGSPEEDVRIALALRLVDLLPALAPEKHSQIYAYAVQALMSLAQDEVSKVRRALSSALVDYAKAPPAVVSRLARDVEREIAEPVLRRCIALGDDDMLDLLAAHPEPWVISAIAGRPEVSEEVSDAVVATGDMKGTAVLISNSGARISTAALQGIVTMARNHPEWHRPLALRPELTVELTREMAGFVGEKVLHVLRDRSDLDAATRTGVAAIVERRLSYVSGGRDMTAAEKVVKYQAAGTLTADMVQDAFAWQERDFATLALAALAAVPAAVALRMLSSGARPAIALCWLAQLPVRMIVDVQRHGARVQPRDLVYPKGGTEYPLTDDEIAWQLEFFGIKK